MSKKVVGNNEIKMINASDAPINYSKIVAGLYTNLIKRSLPMHLEFTVLLMVLVKIPCNPLPKTLISRDIKQTARKREDHDE